MTLEAIAAAVTLEPAGKHVSMRTLRDLHSPERRRLSPDLSEEIRVRLRQIGIITVPSKLSTHESDMVHLIAVTSDLGLMISAMQVLLMRTITHEEGLTRKDLFQFRASSIIGPALKLLDMDDLLCNFALFGQRKVNESADSDQQQTTADGI